MQLRRPQSVRYECADGGSNQQQKRCDGERLDCRAGTGHVWLLGLGGLARLIWLVWLDRLFWLGDGFDVHCYLRADFIMAGGTELRVRSPIYGFSITCCSDGDGLAYRIKCLSLGDCLQRELDLLV